MLSIRGQGIGRATVKCPPGQQPREMIVRAYLRGLESLTIANEHVKWQAAVLSHGDYASLLNLWQDGKEGPPLTKASPYWTAIHRFDATGKPCAGLPPAGGWFELRACPRPF